MLRDPHRKKKIIALLWLDTESWVADTSRNFSELFQNIEIKFLPLLSLAASNFAKLLTQKMTEQTINNAMQQLWMKLRAILYHKSKYDIPRNVWQQSPECSAAFLGMFGNIPRNFWRYSPECLTAFPGMFDDILRNVWKIFREWYFESNSEIRPE